MLTRQLVTGAVTTVLVGATLVATPATHAGAAPTSTAAGTTDYVVLYERGADPALAEREISAAGGTVVESSAGVGYAVVRSDRSDFTTRAAQGSQLVGAARNTRIGTAPAATHPDRAAVEQQRAGTTKGAHPATSASATGEPLSDLQWDMRAIDATPTGSYAVQDGSRKVLVGIIDTGVDGSHPDVAPNFDAADSRNFTTDNPLIDGPCEVASCKDPADVDENGHGTHVASTIGSPRNGVGIAGVAPGVTLVNLRAGQDSGYFFLQPTLDALTYAGDLGVDVVNMSFYVDPWLYNCTDNPADTAAEQQEQRVVREATQRAVDYARNKGVLPVAAMGNGATDLGKPAVDATSPDFPPGAQKLRTIDNGCITVPTETDGVVSVTSTGISGRKAYYSDYGVEQADVAAPGGDVYDTPGGTRDYAAGVLAAYPRSLAVLKHEIDADGDPVVPYVVKDCSSGTCSYYQYLQGTSMAAPHAAGVAALVVSEHGRPDKAHHGELTLAPSTTERILLGTATDTPCPEPRTYTYTRISAVTGATLTSTATCEGGTSRNGFYGDGIVNALAAVS